MKKYLCVCYVGLSRSSLVGEYISKLLKKNNIEAIVESAGFTPSSPIQLTKEVCQGADIIFVMEQFMKDKIIEEYNIEEKKIVNLNVFDIYSWGGTFVEKMLSQLITDKNEEEGSYIMGLEEIRNRLSLFEVLEVRQLEKYIIQEPMLLMEDINNKIEWEGFIRNKGLVPLVFDKDPEKRRILKPVYNIFNQNVNMLEKWYNKAHSLGLNSFYVKMMENGLELQYLGNSNLNDLIQYLDLLDSTIENKKEILNYFLDDIVKQSIKLISNYHPHNDLKPSNIMISNNKAYFVDPSPIPLHNSRYPDINLFVDSLYSNLKSTKTLKDESRNIIIFYLKKLIKYGVNIKHPLFKQDLEEKIMYNQ